MSINVTEREINRMTYGEKIDLLVHILCDPRLYDVSEDNIMLPLAESQGNAYVHGGQMEEELTFCQQEFEQVEVDGGACGDVFQWFYGRDLELGLIDAEAEIDRQAEKLEEARQRFINKHMIEQVHTETVELRPHATGRPRFRKVEKVTHKLIQSPYADKAKGRGIKQRMDFEAYVKDIDSRYVEQEDDGIDCPSLGAGLQSYLEMYIDRMTPTEWILAFDYIEESLAMKKVKNYQGETISWYYYTQCALALLYRLAKYSPRGGWAQELERVRNNNQVSGIKSATFEDSFHGSMSFDMESAIDSISEARALAETYNMSPEEAWNQLVAQAEDCYIDLPEEEPETYNDILVDFYSEILIVGI